MKKTKKVCAVLSVLLLASAFAGASGEVAKLSDNLDGDVAATTAAFSHAPTLPKFIDHRDYPAADNPTNLASGDLNGDGIADLVVPNFNSNNISVLLGKANGSFQQVRLFDDGVGRPFDAVIADFNGDGKNDVAVTIPVTGVLIMLGDGAGNLTPTAILPAGS